MRRRSVGRLASLLKAGGLALRPHEPLELAAYIRLAGKERDHFVSQTLSQCNSLSLSLSLSHSPPVELENNTRKLIG